VVVQAIPELTRRPPAWLEAVLGTELPTTGEFEVQGRRFTMRDGIPREIVRLTPTQAQTAAVFQYLWERGTFRGVESRRVLRTWYVERYGDAANASWWDDYGPEPLLVDAGCGAGISAIELFGDRLRSVRYLGVDVSSAVDRAAATMGERQIPASFMQADIGTLPLAPGSVDVIYSQGVMHHTDSTSATFRHLASLLNVGGRFLFYVYRRKGPVREFTDDYVRQQLSAMTLDEAWNAMMPLTRLGQQLGQLDVALEVAEDVPLLGISAGLVPVQRFFYWNIAKAFYHPDLTLDEMNHINLDWYAPANAHRHSVEEVREWCADTGLVVEHENVQPAGITMIARRRR
jgi:arsenite methyltransferase